MFLRKASLTIVLLFVWDFLALAVSPNIILITIDTARTDKMGFLGSKAGLTPNLDRLARQGIVFSRAYAHVPLTTPSHATILTGTYPQFNHLNDLGTPLAKDIPYLPDILRQRGYHTAAVVGSQVLDPKSVAVPGFDRGFDMYDADFHSRQPEEDRYHSVERRAERVVEHAEEWLKRRPTGPFFLWVHLYDPHDPYDPPAPFKERYATKPYEGEIAYSDFAIGKLITALHSQSLYDGALIAIVADHGEAFGEHDEISHGFFLYDETLHVPLVIKLPGEQDAGLRVDRRARLVDVTPTILRAAGMVPPEAMQGEDLLKANDSKSSSGDRPAYSETDYPHRAFGWSALYGWRAGKYLYIDAPEPELYDQMADPSALHNLAGASKAVAETMAAQLREFRRKTSGVKAAGAELNPEQLEQLQALGYVTSGFKKPASGDKERGPDPKGKIRAANALHEALLAMEDDRFKDAIPRLELVVKEEPEMPLANLELGRAWGDLGEYGKALPWLRKGVALSPESGRAHFELGIALSETDEWNAAIPELEAAVARTPDSDEAHFALATAYEHEGRIDDAKRQFQAALKINPEHYKANLMFGRLLGMHGNADEALPFLKKAVELQPQLPDGHKFLGNVYTELGKAEDARRERSEAERLNSVTAPH